MVPAEEERWSTPPSWPCPGGERIEVWRVRFDVPDRGLARLARCLSPGEQARADRFRVESARREFVIMRAALRLILARTLDLAPGDITIAPGPLGKPYLGGGDDLAFNVSHADGCGLVALARRRWVGVDLERRTARPLLATLGPRVLSPTEQDRLAAVPVAGRPDAFLRVWTGKEAIAKATGVGLSLPMASCTLPRHGTGLVQIDGTWDSPFRSVRWQAAALTPTAGHVGSVVVDCPDRPVVVRRWDFDLAAVA